MIHIAEPERRRVVLLRICQIRIGTHGDAGM